MVKGSSRVALSAVEFDVVWEWLGLGATPLVLRLSSPGRTYAERQEILDAAWQGLRRRGLATDNGPDPEIIRLMHLLAVPAQQVELRLWLVEEARVLAAARAGATALAVRRHNLVALSGLGAAATHAVLTTLPGARVGAGHSVTLPTAELNAAHQANADGCPMYQGLTDLGVSAGDAELLETILAGVLRRGQFSVLASDAWGVPHRLRRVLNLLDTRHGRYLMTQDRAADGTEWTTLAPTDARRLLHRLDELLAEATVHADRR